MHSQQALTLQPLQEEVAVISGALDLTHKTAVEAMTPLDKVFMLSSQQPLDDECIQLILARGHSRIPVYGASRTDLLGLILVKEILRHVIDNGQVRRAVGGRVEKELGV